MRISCSKTVTIVGSWSTAVRNLNWYSLTFHRASQIYFDSYCQIVMSTGSQLRIIIFVLGPRHKFSIASSTTFSADVSLCQNMTLYCLAQLSVKESFSVNRTWHRTSVIFTPFFTGIKVQRIVFKEGENQLVAYLSNLHLRLHEWMTLGCRFISCWITVV